MYLASVRSAERLRRLPPRRRPSKPCGSRRCRKTSITIGPEDAAKCTIKAEKRKGQTGWIIRDADGKILREFVDTNGDNIVDRWSYYKDGVEVYRDIDTKFTGKANEFRWLNTAGIRWGVDEESRRPDRRLER